MRTPSSFTLTVVAFSAPFAFSGLGVCIGGIELRVIVFQSSHPSIAYDLLVRLFFRETIKTFRL